MPADPAQTHIEKTFNYTAPLVSCRFDPTGRFVFAGAQDNKVVRWTLADGKKTELAAHDSWVRGFAFSANGEEVVTSGYDGSLIWWSATAEQPMPIRTIDAHQGWVRAVVLSPDGQTLATCGNDLKVKLWRMADGSLVRELSGHDRHVYHLAFHPTVPRLVSGDLIAKFVDWDLATGQATRSFTIASLTKYDPGFQADYGGPHCLTFVPDGKRLIAGGITNVSNAFAGIGNPIVVEIDWEAGKDAVTHLTKGNINGVAWGLAWHPEGYVVAALGGHAGGQLFFWKPDQKDEFHAFNLGNSVRDLSLHPDGLRVATAHHDHNLRIALMAPKAA